MSDKLQPLLTDQAIREEMERTLLSDMAVLFFDQGAKWARTFYEDGQRIQYRLGNQRRTLEYLMAPGRVGALEKQIAAVQDICDRFDESDRLDPDGSAHELRRTILRVIYRGCTGTKCHYISVDGDMYHEPDCHVAIRKDLS